jgi:hypothetical protein
MRMHRELIKHYLKKLTMGRGINNPDPLEDFSNFDGDINGMRRDALADGNLDWLRLSLDALIARPGGRIQDFAGQQYPFSDAELVALLSYAFARIWPDVPLSEPGEEADLEFVDMSNEDWALLTNRDA